MDLESLKASVLSQAEECHTLLDKKAIAEIRKLMTMNNCRIDKIRGCYVDENREIVTELKETFLALEESTVEKYCEIFRKTLGGKIGRNLFNLEFPLAEEEAGGKQDGSSLSRAAVRS